MAEPLAATASGGGRTSCSNVDLTGLMDMAAERARLEKERGRIQGAIRPMPFRPIAIRLADGRSLHVPHRDFLSDSPSGRIVIVYQAPGFAGYCSIR